jgi:hypothetical protein
VGRVQGSGGRTFLSGSGFGGSGFRRPDILVRLRISGFKGQGSGGRTFLSGSGFGDSGFRRPDILVRLRIWDSRVRVQKREIFCRGFWDFFPCTGKTFFKSNWQVQRDWKIRVCGAAFLGNRLLNKYQEIFKVQGARKWIAG